MSENKVAVPAVQRTFLYQTYMEPKWNANDPIAPFHPDENLMLMDARDYWQDMEKVRWSRVPNFTSTMKLLRVESGKFILQSVMGYAFHVYPTEFTEALLKLGMSPGGDIPEAIWQVIKRGGKYTIKMVENE